MIINKKRRDQKRRQKTEFTQLEQTSALIQKTGGGFSQVREFSGPFDLPPFSDFIENNVDSIYDESLLSDDIVFVKHRDDYKEFSCYLPLVSSSEWSRHYFSNRLNTGNDGFCRLVFASHASLTGSVGDSFTENNTNTHVPSISGVQDVIVGTGNTEYAVKCRRFDGAQEEFVSGTHGHETLIDFKIFVDDVEKDYVSDFVLNARNVCKKLQFIATTRLEFKDSTNQWAEVVYNCTLDKFGYSFTVDREIIANAEVETDYLDLFMVPNTQSTQKYGLGFDDIAYSGARTKLLNTYNNSQIYSNGFHKCAFYNSELAVYSEQKNLSKTLEHYSDLNTDNSKVSLLTSRTDKFSKCYNIAYTPIWQTLSIGDILSSDRFVKIRKGSNVDLLPWGNDESLNYTNEYSPDLTENGHYLLRDTTTNNINPNPTNDANLTVKGFTNSFMTRASLDALNDSIVNFVTQASSPVFRTAVYADGTVLSANGIFEGNNYVFR